MIRLVTFPLIALPSSCEVSMSFQIIFWSAIFFDSTTSPSRSSLRTRYTGIVSPTRTSGAPSGKLSNSEIGILPSDLYPTSTMTPSLSILITVPLRISPSSKVLKLSSIASSMFMGTSCCPTSGASTSAISISSISVVSSEDFSSPEITDASISDASSSSSEITTSSATEAISTVPSSSGDSDAESVSFVSCSSFLTSSTI